MTGNWPNQALKRTAAFVVGLLEEVDRESRASLERSAAQIGGPAVRVIAEGKEAVLAHLEDQLAGLPGHPGRYSLAEDDCGRLVIWIAGCTFIGEGEAVLAGDRLTVCGGVVKHLEPAKAAEPGAAPDPAG